MGYKKIYVLGIDSNYVEIKRPKVGEDGILRKTIKDDPNYFFDGYQRRGDVMHISTKGNNKNINHLKLFKKIGKKYKGRVVHGHAMSKLVALKIFPYEMLPTDYLLPEDKQIKISWKVVNKRIARI